MATNTHTFSPNDLSTLSSAYSTIIKLVAGDSDIELRLELKNSECEDGIDLTDPTTWGPLDLSGYQTINLYVREVGETVLVATLNGAGVAPLEDGIAIALMPASLLENISGDYEMEVEVVYANGRVVTVYDLVGLEIRQDFSGHGA